MTDFKNGPEGEDRVTPGSYETGPDRRLFDGWKDPRINMVHPSTRVDVQWRATGNISRDLLPGEVDWRDVAWFKPNDETVTSELKATNPKDAIGSDKLPVHLWPETATAMGCLGLLDGMLKYGRSNWRSAGVRSSIYVDAARRHVARWFEGEDNDPDSGLPHLSHALACLAILVDAQAAGKLNDDRQVRGGFADVLATLTPHVARLKALHAGKTPRHFTIEDNDA